MFIKENIMLAIAGLKSNKMRALLTMLGIIIGIASVIGVVSVGNSMTNSVTSSMSEMGSSNIMINVQEKSSTTTNKNTGKAGISDGNKENNNQSSDENKKDQDTKDGQQKEGPGGGGAREGSGAPGGGRAPGSGGVPGGGRASGGGGMPGRGRSSTTGTPQDKDLLSMSQIDELQDNFSDKINSLSISETGSSGKAKDGSLYANVNIVGTNTGYEDVKNIEVTDGRYISEKDMDGNKTVAVVSDKLVSKMFSEGIDPIDQKIKVYTSDKILTYTIVGVYKYKSSGNSSTSSEENLTTDIYVPVTIVKTATSKNYQSVTIKAKNDVDVQAFTDELSTYLSNLYARNDKWEAKASNMESMLESMTSMMSTISLAISAIAGISLLVGGIGVMNIMLVSVTERTREIGTRKALGAKSTHIQMQFIVESMIICAIGGVLGIIVGIGMGTLASNLMGYSAKIQPVVILISFTFSMAIGVFFGYYPAKKAAKLDPIEALRYE